MRVRLLRPPTPSTLHFRPHCPPSTSLSSIQPKPPPSSTLAPNSPNSPHRLPHAFCPSPPPHSTMPTNTPFAVPGYTLDKSIGEGNAGTVFRARSRHAPKSAHARNFAVKIIPRSKVSPAVRREVAIHMRLRHPNIIRLHRVLSAAQSNQFSSSRSYPSASRYARPIPSPSPSLLALVMDHAPAGDMFTEVSSAGSLHPRVVRSRLRHITAALQYLHNNGIVHLDVKLENVVINNSSSAKLIDFGCARDIHSNLDSPHHSSLGGTLHYMPPEVVESAKNIPLPSSDAWSLGVLTYTALVGHYPFTPTTSDKSKDNDEATRHRIINCPPHSVPSSIRLPSDLRRIVFGLLEKDPRKRMTIPQVIAELEQATEFSRYRQFSTVAKQPSAKHIICQCPPKRPRSPSSATEADFTTCTCDAEQSLEDALNVVDSIQHHRMRASREVQEYLSGLDKSSVMAASGR